MRYTIYIQFCVLLTMILTSNAQDNTHNPYKSLGKKAEILTLSDGLYQEFFDTDSIEIIGSAILNTNTMQVVGFVEYDTLYSEATLEPEVVSRWLSPDPLAVKYPEMSPYHFVKNDPIIYIDPDGRENKYALAWARESLANKGKPFDVWYGSKEGGWTFNPDKVPNYTVCYEACWTAYMQSGGQITEYLNQSGFSSKSSGFKGRVLGIEWFKAGTGENRSFVSDISNGELGDIVFMGENRADLGHSVLLAELPEAGSYENEEGKIIETMTLETLSTASDSDSGNYGERTFTFEKQDGKWIEQGTGYEFKGFGQLNEDNLRGDPKLLEEDTNNGTSGGG